MMKGWKTWTGVIGAVLTGIAVQYLGVDAGVVSDTTDKVMDLLEAAQVAFAGLAAIGIGHKLEKGPKNKT